LKNKTKIKNIYIKNKNKKTKTKNIKGSQECNTRELTPNLYI